MIKKTMLVLLILCLPMSGVALAGPVSSGVGYVASETAAVIANVVLFPFRVIVDIFNPPPLPPRPILVPYAYPPPMVVAAPQAAPVAPQAVAPSVPARPAPVSNSVDVNIPNGDGSYTLVTLKKTDKGFLGPQGEFYEDHPTEQQLRERYIKGK